MSDLIKFDIDDGIATITLNQPETRNPISDIEMIDALEETLVKLSDDKSIRVAILTGAGKGFSSGGNLKKMGKNGGLNDELPVRTRQNYKNGIQRLPLAFHNLEVPVIAAVNGPAIGAGCDLACMCDIRIASDRAVFAESFVKVGIVPGDGGAWLLPRVVGFAKACEMSLTGDPIDANEALAFGLVSKVVSSEDLLGEARKMAKRIAVNPPHAVRLTKKLLRQAQDNDLKTVLELSAAFQSIAHATEDHNEAVNALLEKRTGVFSGC